MGSRSSRLRVDATLVLVRARPSTAVLEAVDDVLVSNGAAQRRRTSPRPTRRSALSRNGAALVFCYSKDAAAIYQVVATAIQY